MRWLRWVAALSVPTVVAVGGALLLFGPSSGASTSAPPAFRGGFAAYEPLETPAPAPEVEFLDANGEPIKLDALQGRVVLLNFWATWCAPCVKELPALEDLHKALAGEDFTVLLVSVDRKGAEVTAPFLADLGITALDTAIDARSELARAFGAAGLPTTYVIDRDGRVRGRLQGDADWASGAAKRLIQHYIDEE